MDLQALFLSSIDELSGVRPNGRRLVVAVSGGRDSMVLLDLCVQLADRLPFELSAIHVNHGWSANADLWEQHVVRYCTKCNVPLTLRRLQLGSSDGQSPEEQAREGRYACFTQLLQPQDVLLTAHHQADQAETVLLNLLRGSGPRGLAGIPQGRALGDGWIWRPLLNAGIGEIERYAAHRQLSWVDDESNLDERFRRNFIRHSVSPLLSLHWPKWQANVSRTAKLCRDLDLLTSELAEQELGAIISDNGALDLSALSSLSQIQQQLLVRRWLWSTHGQWPSQQVVSTLLQQIVGASGDAQPVFEWQGWTVRRHQNKLLLLAPAASVPDLPADSYWERGVNGQFAPFILPENGRLEMRRAPAPAMSLPAGQWRVAYRQGGEKLRLPGRPRKAVKQLMQEAGLPVWQRQQIPMLWVGDQLAWVAGIGFDEQFLSDEPAGGWLPVWLKETP